MISAIKSSLFSLFYRTEARMLKMGIHGTHGTRKGLGKLGFLKKFYLRSFNLAECPCGKLGSILF